MLLNPRGNVTHTLLFCDAFQINGAFSSGNGDSIKNRARPADLKSGEKATRGQNSPEGAQPTIS